MTRQPNFYTMRFETTFEKPPIVGYRPITWAYDLNDVAEKKMFCAETERLTKKGEVVVAYMQNTTNGLDVGRRVQVADAEWSVKPSVYGEIWAERV